MDLRPITSAQKKLYNSTVTHVVQSWEWGEFRERLGLKVLRYGLFENGKLKTAFQITLHPVPFLGKNMGYLPKGPFPNKALAQALTEIGRSYNCLAVKVEPNIELPTNQKVDPVFKTSSHPLFTKHNFILDLTQSEEELLKRLHPKTRYNIRVAQKHGVLVEEQTDESALKSYLKLYFETTKRQGYFGHSERYHQLVWEVLQKAGIARILLASYKGKPLTAWMLFAFADTLYYPYGGSSTEFKEVMANNLVAWEAIKLGKRLKLKKFDMWGALGPTPNPKDPWMGFHRFKQGYGGRAVEYLGSFDLVLNPLYYPFTLIDSSTQIKAFLLKLIGR